MLNSESRRFNRDSYEKRISDAFLSGDNEAFDEAVFLFKDKFGSESFDVVETEESELSQDYCVEIAFGRTALAIFDIERKIAEDAELKKAYKNSKFNLRSGHEIGQHLHLYDKERDIDTGLVAIVSGDEKFRVFLDRHRIGKVKNPLPVDRIGRKQRKYISLIAIDKLREYNIATRRRQKEDSILIYSDFENDEID